MRSFAKLMHVLMQWGAVLGGEVCALCGSGLPAGRAQGGAEPKSPTGTVPQLEAKVLCKLSRE